ncbi:PTPRH [Bugula neritina]|uniref:protein-tyrosine-phosphatase n=1 Tax=Bugula neritina TaxID=10212 RepID=A0A7J7JTA0_BUGNE|nr:PTPRH [Bugula neritina]
MSIALLPENKGKNRYKGLYPGNLHRVKLDRPNGSDYINATYLEGYYRDNHYIAAQGATQATVNDFWFMIWQEHPSAIIMVTQAMENGRVVRI